MRPRRLQLQGFGPFAEPVDLDFTDVELFALVGPTGAGKSTVIDAMCFALYGSVPRYDDRRLVGSVVHALASEARVAFTFELGGAEYVALRVVRRDAKGKATTRDVRLEQVDGPVLAGAAKEMEPAVVALLGLSFEQFTRAVVLPQGEFARFLHDKPADRQDLLAQLLGLDVYERVAQRARAVGSDAGARVRAERERLDALAASTPDARAQLTARTEALTAAEAEWRGAETDLAGLTERVDAARADVRQAEQRIGALGAVAPPEGVGDDAEVLAGARAALAEASERVAAAVTARSEADAAREAAGDPGDLRTFRDAWTTHAQLTARLGEEQAALAAAQVAEDEAGAARDQAEAALEETRAANATVVVREHLHDGDVCPVCEQTVATVPPVGAIADIAAARERAATVAKAAARASEARAKAASTVEGTTRDLDAYTVRLATAPSLEAVTAALDAVARAQAAVKEAGAAEQSARKAEQAASGALARLERAAEGRRREFRDARDALVGLGLAPPTEVDDLGASWESLAAWAVTEVERIDAGLTATRRTATEAEAARAARLATLIAAARALDLPVGDDATLADLLNALHGERRVTEERRDRLDADLKERAQLEQAIAGRAADAEVANELARLLDASHFERWLVTEALTRLVADASVRLRELSNQRYSFAFTDGRDFQVVDHTQADERRSVRTLSGGETFMASLALALALSDQLAELAPGADHRLGSIFLDEGFGTLDADTLDTVAGAIENLGAGDRMVGIVTHVPELAARVPVQFRVRRVGSGATVERIDS